MTPVRPIRVKFPFWGFDKGHVIPEAAPGIAQDLIARNLAEYADLPKEQNVNGYVHRMMEPMKRKRGRPRKDKT